MKVVRQMPVFTWPDISVPRSIHPRARLLEIIKAAPLATTLFPIASIWNGGLKFHDNALGEWGVYLLFIFGVAGRIEADLPQGAGVICNRTYELEMFYL